MDYKRLSEIVESDRQREACLAMDKHGNERRAAKEMGVAQSSFHNLLGRASKYAATRGWDPKNDLFHTVGDGQILKGVSTLYKNDEVVMQWVKTNANLDRQLAMLQEVVAELCDDIKPIKPTKGPKRLDKDTLNLHVLSDAHLGMYSWAEETGADWDLDKAEGCINNAMRYLSGATPPASTAIFVQLGDGLHSDGLLPVTPTSGHILDQDSRFHKVVRTAVRTFRNYIDYLLAKHEKVVFLAAQGNHDTASSVWLQEAFHALYDREPRVEVIRSPLPYYAMEHGDLMLGFHHGHKRRGAILAEIFASTFREMHGRTKQTLIHTGHLHSKKVEVEEYGNTIIEQHQTVAARDAYSAHLGYGGGRSMQAISYHKKNLEFNRCIFKP